MVNRQTIRSELLSIAKWTTQYYHISHPTPLFRLLENRDGSNNNICFDVSLWFLENCLSQWLCCYSNIQLVCENQFNIYTNRSV